MDWMDAEELAVAVLGLDEETAGMEEIENALFEKFECSFDQFHQISEALMPFTIPATVAISGESFHGFVKDGAFLARLPVTDKP